MSKDKLVRPTWLSLCINLAYALYNGALGFLSHSWWFITLSAYYGILSVMRFAALQIKRKAATPTDEQFVKRFTGVFLVVLSFSLVGTVILSVTADRGISYHKIVMIAIATYTFTKIALAIVHLVKARGDHSPVVKTLRSISFADAVVSVFSLQRSMLVSFEGMTPANVQLFNVLTGSATCIIVCLLGLYLIGGKRTVMATSKLVDANKALSKAVKKGYKKTESAVVSGYKKVEGGVVGGYTKIEDLFVERYLAHDGENVEEAKARLKNKDK